MRGLSFFQHGDNDDLHFGLMEAFPQLKDDGGYELLKANQSHMLEVIPSPADGTLHFTLRMWLDRERCISVPFKET